MKNLKEISRDGLRSILGGTVNCRVPKTTLPAICQGNICPSDPCATPSCLIPIYGCTGLQ
ncbi:hypothetical protein M2347_001511 [Chryseobacterium sp. H1D6B]|nr:hypothetical protein [Chryseobacterium sp. H1D6B]